MAKTTGTPEAPKQTRENREPAVERETHANGERTFRTFVPATPGRHGERRGYMIEGRLRAMTPELKEQLTQTLADMLVADYLKHHAKDGSQSTGSERSSEESEPHPEEMLLRQIQTLVATLSVSPSAVRGQGAPRVVDAARDFLAVLDLKRFGTRREGEFRRELEAATERLCAALPAGARSWGLARKLVNIFLRDCCYNHYLRRQYGLERAEAFYETPLDSIAVRELKKWARQRRRARLPRWRGVKRLVAAESERFQAAATDFAGDKGTPRLHADAYLWVRGRQHG